MKFIADGEFGEETVEADSFEEAAEKTAENHAGLDCDEICRDPFSFSIRLGYQIREYRAELSQDDVLDVVWLHD